MKKTITKHPTRFFKRWDGSLDIFADGIVVPAYNPKDYMTKDNYIKICTKKILIRRGLTDRDIIDNPTGLSDEDACKYLHRDNNIEIVANLLKEILDIQSMAVAKITEAMIKFLFPKPKDYMPELRFELLTTDLVEENEHTRSFISIDAENVDKVDRHGFALIHYASGSGGLKLIKALRALGSNLDLFTASSGADDKPITPLIIAIKNGKVAAANLLLKQGASPDLMVDSLSPWAYAIRHKTLAPEFTSILILNNADISRLHRIIEKHGSSVLTRLEVKPELVDKVVFSVNGGAETLLNDYFSKQTEDVVITSYSFTSDSSLIYDDSYETGVLGELGHYLFYLF